MERINVEHSRLLWCYIYFVIGISTFITVSFGLSVTLMSVSESENFPIKYPGGHMILAGMLITTAAACLSSWFLIIKYRCSIRRWLLAGISTVSIGSVCATVTPSIEWEDLDKATTAAIFAPSLMVTAAGNGLVFGSSLCAAPHIPSVLTFFTGHTINENPSRPYWSFLLVVPLGLTAAFAVTPWIYKTDIYMGIYFLAFTILMLVVLLGGWKMLKDEHFSRDSVCPFRVFRTTFRHGRPMSSVLCLVASGYSFGYLLPYVKPYGDSNSTESGWENDTVPTSRFQNYNFRFNYFFIMFIPMVFVPFVIDFLLMKRKTAKMLKIIFCFLLAYLCVLFHFLKLFDNNTKFIFWFVSLALIRALLVAATYTDLMWQVFDATDDSSLILCGTGSISIVVSIFGSVSGILLSMWWVTIDHHECHCFLFWLIPAVCWLIVVVTAIQGTCCPGFRCRRCEERQSLLSGAADR